MKTPLRLSAIFLLLALAAPLTAATVAVSVTSVSGRDVFIDGGTNSGITPGLRVRFFPSGSPPVEGIVADASSSSARIELDRNVIPPPTGTSGQVIVPESPQGNASGDPTTLPGTPPQHPAWERQEQPRTPEMPLLAPAFSTPPGSRPPTFHGRMFTSFDGSLDQANGRDSRYYLGRLGGAFTLTNPFGEGGDLYFNGEFDERGSDIDNFGTSNSNYVIVNRLSYVLGDQKYSPYRLEIGRFYSHYLPEIGQVDGVEGAMRFENGFNVGGGLGGYPLPFPRPYPQDNLGFHVFLDYESPQPKGFTGAVGYQKTWFGGAPDRDIIVAHATDWLTKDLWVYGSARVDIYGSGDKLKSAGPHLTDAWLQARYAPDPTRGLSASYSHYTWADVQGAEFQLAPPDLIRKGRVDRAELAWWHDLGKDLRPTLRGNFFEDQQGNGYAGEFDLDRTNLFNRLDLHGDVFYTEATYTTDYGFRTEARYHSGPWQLFGGYEFYRYRPRGTLGTGDYQLRNTVRAGVAFVHHNWYYNLEADHTFGDSDNAYIVHLYAEYRF